MPSNSSSRMSANSSLSSSVIGSSLQRVNVNQLQLHLPNVGFYLVTKPVVTGPPQASAKLRLTSALLAKQRQRHRPSPRVRHLHKRTNGVKPCAYGCAAFGLLAEAVTTRLAETGAV